MRPFISVIFFFASVCIYSCTKIDSTVLGSDLIPAVDNVNTFDTLIDVTTINTIQSDDTTKLGYNELMAVGQTKDLLFGQTDATLYFEMKPTNFSSAAANALANNFKDTTLAKYDSTVLCLRYSGSYGDTTQSVTFDVYMLTTEFTDTIRYSLKEPPPSMSMSMVGTKTVFLKSLDRDSTRVYRSTTFNYKTVRELRIPLDSGIFNPLALLRDTTALGSDVNYSTKFKGFALKMHAQSNSATGSMAYFSISDTASKLEFYYTLKNSGTTVRDTTRTTFYFNPNNSGFADNIIWTRGGEIVSHLSPSQPDPFVYIKTTPGTATRIKIPGLETLSNRIVHRAELKMYQVPPVTPQDGYLVVPPLLYLEKFTPGNVAFNTYETLPFDLSPNTAYGDCFPVTNGIDYAYFGGFPKMERVNNVDVNAYTFNISRYVQKIITNKLTNADLRLSSNLYSQYAGCGLGTAPIKVTSNPVAYGRVRLGGGSLSGTNAPYKMRLRIIYSKL